MNSRQFMKWYMLIFGAASLVMMSFSLKIWEYELGRIFIWCVAVWLVVSLIVIAVSLWGARPK